MHNALKYSSLLSYMLKPYHLLTQVFDNNSMAQEKLLKQIILGHRKSGGRGEYFSVLILMLRPPDMNDVS